VSAWVSMTMAEAWSWAGSVMGSTDVIEDTGVGENADLRATRAILQM